MLKREVGLLGAVAYGVGIIVGAGVYALIGRAAGHAGNSVWLSFILAAAVASFTGLSFALEKPDNSHGNRVNRAFRKGAAWTLVGIAGVIMSGYAIVYSGSNLAVLLRYQAR